MTLTIDKLNTKEDKFCLNIASGMKKGQAAKEAGYSPKNCSAIASQLLNKAKIKERIAQLMQPEYDRALCSIRERQQIYSNLARIELDEKRMSEDGKLKAKLEGLHRLNQMEHVYSDAPTNDNRSYTLVMLSDDPRAKEALNKLMAGSIERAPSE